MSILLFILILSFLVIIHELGHYFVAKWRKVKVEEFGFGYPPKIATLFKHKGTIFTINAFPLGGFVKMEGEEEHPENDKHEVSKKTEQTVGPFYSKTSFSRIAIIIAGPLVNFLFGVLAFSFIFSVMGIPINLENQPRITELAPDSPAKSSGLKTNTNIIGFKVGEDFSSTQTIDEVQEFVSNHRGENVTVITTDDCVQESCPSGSNESSIYLRTEDEVPQNQGTMGVVFTDYYFKYYPWYIQPWRGIMYGLNEAVMMGGLMITSLGQVISDILSGGGVPAEIAGPVGIIHHAQKSDLASKGWMSIMSFAGMLSINLAIMNILPIPALDGGRILIILLEKVLGRNIIRKVEGYVNYGGFVFLMGLIILITIKDVSRIFGS